MSPVYCQLPERVCIEVRGPDAASFLHAQLSRTIDTLASAHAPLAAWLDARGRVRALLRVARLDDRFLLLTERDLVATLVPKLRMFVLRAAVVIEPNDQWRVAALVDPLATASAAPPEASRDALVVRGDLRWLRIGAGLWHVLGTRAAVEGFDAAVARAPEAAAALAELRLGIPAVTTAVAERYVPQMLNLDRLDALSFDKGCYPGQEVVARVRHLGSVKRRMRRYGGESASAPAPGTEVATAAGQPAGEIVRAAPADGGFEVLAVVDDAAAAGQLFAAGARLREQPLP